MTDRPPPAKYSSNALPRWAGFSVSVSCHAGTARSWFCRDEPTRRLTGDIPEPPCLSASRVFQARGNRSYQRLCRGSCRPTSSSKDRPEQHSIGRRRRGLSRRAAEVSALNLRPRAQVEKSDAGPRLAKNRPPPGIPSHRNMGWSLPDAPNPRNKIREPLRTTPLAEGEPVDEHR